MAGIKLRLTNSFVRQFLSNTINFDMLINDADKAMYQVKKNGKNNYQIKV